MGAPSMMLAERATASSGVAGRPLRTVIIFAVGAALFAGCRADTLTAPQATNCTGQIGCGTVDGAPVDAMVIESLADGSSRLVQGIGSTSVQSALSHALTMLTANLNARKYSAARTALAQVYALLDPLRITIADGSRIDLPDASALRLELIPVANTLGVQAQ